MEILEKVSESLKLMGASVAHVYTETALDPEMGPPVTESSLDPRIVRNLREAGIERFYRYQWEAMEAILNRENLAIISGTGTGKTEAFFIPLLQLALKGERSVLIYPTKALARDQLVRMKWLTKDLSEVRIEVLDGDTPQKVREEIYENPPEILITNPDMIHLGLSLSPRFRSLIRSADHYVVDEMHVYDGVLGSHLRRILDRIRELNGEIHVIGASGTVEATPLLLNELFGVEGKVIRGVPRRRGMAIHALVASNGISRWTISAYLAGLMVKEGLRILVFVDSQQMAERLAKMAERFGANLAVHRAGILASERVEVEEKLREGDLQGVVATPTLELGIDIGSLDAVIMSENPPSYPKYLQRAGRAGRRNRLGLVFTIMGDNPIDSYFLRKPHEFFNRKLTPITFDNTNLEVLKVHASAYVLEKYGVRRNELPSLWVKALDELVKEGIITERGGTYYSTPRTASFVRSSSLRSAGPIVDVIEQKKIGERELPAALFDLYPGATYLVSKRSYRVKSLDLKSLEARVEKMTDDQDYYTKPLYKVDMKEFREVESKKVLGLPVKYGEIKVTVSVVGYVVYDYYSKREKPRAEVEYEEPIEFTYNTKGLIIKHPILEDWDLLSSMEAYHATEHVLIAAGRVVAGGSITDLSGISYPSGHVVIYDSTIGGNGVSRLLYQRLESAYDIALDIVKGCDCEDGCPKCIFDPYCGNNNKVLSRKKSMRLIQTVMNGEGTDYSPPDGESVR
ncbi:ATP-dependent DNA helicase [Metallosphaera sp. J1]|uniref:DEAD/DEAH box helicase n=1 Tax=Metallosphaera javensis (ex Hofmann et al. 2022) TaxID=99938 RepID=UPI001EE0A817|nr:DEAD/DEAH box helicase [Metallosphaera javensis (ex Hofmann et al. 2022)]MCG3109802.1 ATP-dependent DNA helicase [Metallosphaera javensis (ex Hofmann et al. 2022)]